MVMNVPAEVLIKNPPGSDTNDSPPIILAINATPPGPTLPMRLIFSQPYNLLVWGTFDGAEVEPQFSADGITFTTYTIDNDPILFSEQSDQYFFRLTAGTWVRMNFVAPGGGGALINAELR